MSSLTVVRYDSRCLNKLRFVLIMCGLQGRLARSAFRKRDCKLYRNARHQARCVYRRLRSLGSSLYNSVRTRRIQSLRYMVRRGDSANDLTELYLLSARYAQTASALNVAIAGAGMLLERYLLVILELYYVVSACFIQIPVVIILVEALAIVL
jgi:hypothetical protein